MTKAEIRALGHYVRHLADEMGLKDWLFEIYQTDALDEDFRKAEHGRPEAEVTPSPGAKIATVEFLKDFRTENTAVKQREIVVHELLHCHLADMREFVRVPVNDFLSQQTYDALMFGFDLAWEHAVDGMARAWAEKLPLCRWP